MTNKCSFCGKPVRQTDSFGVYSINQENDTEKAHLKCFKLGKGRTEYLELLLQENENIQSN